LVFLPPVAISTSLLNGLFDLDYADVWKSAQAMVLISLASFATAWTLLASTWCTLFNAPDRFNTCPLRSVKYPITWPEREVFGLMALSPIATAIVHSWRQSGVPRLPLLAAAAVGLGIAIVGLLWVNRTANWLGREVQRANPRTFVARRLRDLILWIAS